MRRTLPHIPALDGIRGIGVLGILLFHAGHLTGGWLGVDLFFVLSGFLITSLLLAEFESTGRISLGAFWARRGRRLIPALLATLLGVALYAAVLATPDDLGRIRADALSTLFYVANWNAIFAQHEYWDLFRLPSPLDHTWSLAIEEQFYLLWPPLVYLVLRRPRGAERWLGGCAAALALLSAAWMAICFDVREGTARVYFGTDTRLAAPLVGAALAVMLRGPTTRWPATSRPVADVAALGAAAVLAFAWVFLDGQDPRVYRGALFGLAIAAALLIAGAVLSPRGVVARVAGLAPLRLLGVVSYGVYLWHWPIYLALDTERVGIDGVQLTSLRIGVTLIVATLSYLFLERPIRRGVLSPRWTGALGIAGACAVIGGVLAATQPRVAAELSVAPSSMREFPDASLDVLLIGDSVAQGIGPEFRIQALRRGLRGHVVAQLGCGLLAADRARTPAGREFDLSHCDPIREQWMRQIAERDPRVVVILEGWSGAQEREVGGRWSHPCDTFYDAAFEADLMNAVERYHELDSQAVIVALTPASLADASPRFARASGGADQLARRTECLNRIRRKVSEETGAQLIDLAELICPEGICLREIGTTRLRSDGIHFRGPGAQLVSEWIFDQIAGLPPAR